MYIHLFICQKDRHDNVQTETERTENELKTYDDRAYKPVLDTGQYTQ